MSNRDERGRFRGSMGGQEKTLTVEEWERHRDEVHEVRADLRGLKGEVASIASLVGGLDGKLNQLLMSRNDAQMTSDAQWEAKLAQVESRLDKALSIESSERKASDSETEKKIEARTYTNSRVVVFGVLGLVVSVVIAAASAVSWLDKRSKERKDAVANALTRHMDGGHPHTVKAAVDINHKEIEALRKAIDRIDDQNRLVLGSRFTDRDGRELASDLGERINANSEALVDVKQRLARMEQAR